MIPQPEGPFEIEIIGWLVEQQEVRLGEERGRKGDAHSPAAGEFAARTALIRVGEAKAGKDGRGACRRGMGGNVRKTRLNFGDAVRIVGRLRFGEEVRAFGIRLEHYVEQAFRSVRRFLRKPADAPPFWQFDIAVLGGEIAGDRIEESRLARAIPTNESNA
jgi:hypothetical protein